MDQALELAKVRLRDAGGVLELEHLAGSLQEVEEVGSKAGFIIVYEAKTVIEMKRSCKACI